MHKCDFIFAESGCAELIETRYSHPLIERTLRSVRGKTNGAFDATGTFQWTRAVQATSVLFVRAKLCNFIGTPHYNAPSLALSGGHGTLASSLDYAISKQPIWLTDMFGQDRNGAPLTNRIFLRSNSNQKRLGPVTVSLNHKFLNFAHIRLFVNDREVREAGMIRDLLKKIGDAHFFAAQNISGESLSPS